MVEKVSFRIQDMRPSNNTMIVHHIYESSMHQDSDEHPLVLLCTAMTKLYPVTINVNLENSKKAFVTMEFEEHLEKNKVRLLSKRFQTSTEQLLKARMIRIYEKYPS